MIYMFLNVYGHSNIVWSGWFVRFKLLTEPKFCWYTLVFIVSITQLRSFAPLLLLLALNLRRMPFTTVVLVCAAHKELGIVNQSLNVVAPSAEEQLRLIERCSWPLAILPGVYALEVASGKLTFAYTLLIRINHHIYALLRLLFFMIVKSRVL